MNALSLGYQHLSIAQNKIGHPILKDLPNANNEGFFKFYAAMDEWMKGENPDLYKV